MHALSAGWKLAALAALGSAAFVLTRPVTLVFGLVIVVALYCIGRVPLRFIIDQTRSVALLLAIMTGAQALAVGVEPAAALLARILLMVWAAGLVTATTSFIEMMSALERVLSPLRRFGVEPARVGFALTTAVRFVPLLQTMIAQTRDAQAARGLQRNPLALAVPVTIRALRLAERVAESVEARSALTDPAPDNRQSGTGNKA